MTLVGFCSVLLGGCPIRQTILASQGDTDAGITVLGLIAGAAFAHNFGLAASANGVPANGKIAAVIGLISILILAAGVIANQKSIKLNKGAKSNV